MKKGPPFSAIFFDCDSTLTSLEGIDDLAEEAGISEKIQQLTQSAMEGHVALEDVYKNRLELIRPNRNAITRLGKRYVENIVIGARETIHVLHKLKKDVHIISGGILQAVKTLGKELGVHEENTHAVEIFFDNANDYSHFDASHPLTQTNGKGLICMNSVNVEVNNIAIVGDGITDLEASRYGIFVVGFGGIHNRQKVAQMADTFISSSRLDAVLNALLTKEEQKLVN